MKNKVLLKIVLICALLFIIFLFYKTFISSKITIPTVANGTTVNHTEIPDSIDSISSGNGQTAVEILYDRLEELKTTNNLYETKAMNYNLDVIDNASLLKDKLRVEDLASLPMMTSDIFVKYDTQTNEILNEVEQVNVVSSLTQPVFSLHNQILVFDTLFGTPEIYFESTDHPVKEEAINKITKTWNQILVITEAIKKTIDLESVKNPKLKILFSELLMSIELINKNCFRSKISEATIEDSDKLTKYLLKLNKDSQHKALFNQSKVVWDFLIEHYTYKFAKIFNEVPLTDRAEVFGNALIPPEKNEINSNIIYR